VSRVVESIVAHQAPAADFYNKIGTKRTYQIGRDCSYAIGVRDLSLALTGVQQDDLLDLSFWPRSPLHDDDLVVLRTGYHCLPDHGIGPGWSLSVRTVPRSMKAQIRATLIEDGIPRILKP
jgi:hypothetical protein